MILILVFKQREKEAGNRRWIKNKMRSMGKYMATEAEGVRADSMDAANK